jgi:hypothetical protein
MKPLQLRKSKQSENQKFHETYASQIHKGFNFAATPPYTSGKVAYSFQNNEIKQDLLYSYLAQS